MNTPVNQKQPESKHAALAAVLAELAARGRQWLKDNAPAWEAALNADKGASPFNPLEKGVEGSYAPSEGDDQHE